MSDELPPRWRPEVPSPTPEFVPPGWRPSRPAPPPVPVPIGSVDRGGPAEDVFARLLERRIVYITGRLDHSRMSHAAAQLMFLDASGDEPIELRLMCSDADLDPALALADTIDALGVELRSCAAGALVGPTLVVFAAGHQRIAHAHARFALRDPHVSLSGRAGDLAAQVDHYQRQLAAVHDRLARACGQPLERIVEDMRAGLSLSAQEAVEYGLVQRLRG